MKLDTTLNSMDSNMETESQNFRIGDMKIIMSILSKMYSNPKQTLTQEYLCNARDANRESGTSDKIQVTLPTQLNPVLKIRDFGVGLSEERIKNVFVSYGTSTKRSTNGQTGGFGIGSKSAFAYTDSFTITSVCEGFKSVYINSEKGLDRISKTPSTEKNGVTVEIAVKPSDVLSFVRAVQRTVYFWDDKEIPEIKGLDLSKHTYQYKLGNFEFVGSGDLPDFIYNGYGSFTGLIIDGIFYQVSDNVLNTIKSRTKVKEIVKSGSSQLIYLNNGDVQIAPNREEIVNNDKTITKLEQEFKRIHLQLVNEIDKKFKNCKTVHDHIEAYSKLTESFNVDRNVGDYTLKNGQLYSELIGSQKNRMNNCFNSHSKGKLIAKSYHMAGRSYRKTKTDKIINDPVAYLRFDQINNKVLYYIDKELAPVNINNHVRTLLDQNKEVILIPNDLSQVAKDLGAINLTTIPITKPKKVGKAKLSNEAFQIYQVSKWNNSSSYQVHKKASDFDPNTTYYWVDNSLRWSREVNRTVGFITKQGHEVYYLTKKAKKVLTKLSNMKPYETYVKNFKDDGRNYDHYVASNLNKSYILRKLKGKKIDCQLVKQMMKLAEIKLPTEGKLPDELVSDATKKKIQDFVDLNNKWIKEFNKNYGLLTTHNIPDAKADDIAEYINLKTNKGA